MPIMLSYNFEDEGGSKHYARIKSMFERGRWENVGGSCYRYPPLAAKAELEGWFNRVVPALMLFRAYVPKHNI